MSDARCPRASVAAAAAILERVLAPRDDAPASPRCARCGVGYYGLVPRECVACGAVFRTGEERGVKATDE